MKSQIVRSGSTLAVIAGLTAVSILAQAPAKRNFQEEIRAG